MTGRRRVRAVESVVGGAMRYHLKVREQAQAAAVTLTETERSALDDAAIRDCAEDVDPSDWPSMFEAVERIVADRLAAERERIAQVLRAVATTDDLIDVARNELLSVDIDCRRSDVGHALTAALGVLAARIARGDA